MKRYQLLLAALLLGSTLLLAQDQRMTPELLWSLGRVSLQDVSADGQYVLYGVTYYDIEANKGNADLYLLDTRSKDVRQLTQSPKSEHSASFTPDGNIAFIIGGELWQMDTKGDHAKPVQVRCTDSPTQRCPLMVNGYKFAPDGKGLLYIQDVQHDQTVQDLYADLPKADARIIDDLMYRHWDSWHDYAYSNIFYLELNEGKTLGAAVNIMDEPYDSPLNPFGGMEQINWSPDGKAIAYTCKKLSGKDAAVSTNSEIYLYDIESKSTKNLSAPNPGYDVEPAFSPDGRYIAWNSMATPGFEADRNRILLYDRNTGTTSELTAGIDASCNHPQWSPDSKKLYYSSTRAAVNHLYEMAIDQPGKERQLTKGTHDYYSFIPGKNAVVAGRASMSAPMDLYSIDLKSLAVTRLTEVNKDLLAKVEMGKVEQRLMPTTDGKEMLVWMIYPPDFDPSKKYPTLLYCQGGPQSAVSQFWSYRWNFQMMAANDYIIVAPNRRGLPGFGQEWNDQISGDWGGQAMQDLLSAIDEAAKEPFVDENNLGAVGASYGGYSVYWLAGNHEKRFKSFIAHCGVFNLESWYGSTEELFFANQDMGGNYWQEDTPETYRQDSPHKFVQNWDTPILVVHNQKDFRVPLSEGMQAFQAAQLQDIPSRFLYFPEEGHWVLSPQNGILWQRVFFDWLNRTLKQP